MVHRSLKLESILRVALVFALLINAPGILTVKADEGTPTPTETPTEPGTLPTETPTGVPETITPDPFTPTITPTLEATPSETPSPTPTETASPTLEATLTASPTVEVAPLFEIKLSTTPEALIEPGLVQLSWSILGEIPATSPFVLEIFIPEGINLVKRADRNLFDPASRILRLPVQKSSGIVSLISVRASDDLLFTARLLETEAVLAETAYILPIHESYDVQASGGIIQALKNKVKIKFPAGALEEDIVLNAGFPTSESLPDGFSPYVFELKARSKNTVAKQIDRFSEPLTIEVDYSGLSLTEEQEENLYLYWYNEETGDWHALESFTDLVTKKLSATTDHFTVFDIGVNDWRAGNLPTVESFQVAQFTGAATFSMPIKVPAGPGGFQPNITLSYNSQVVDQATTQAQASWVGMGWSLDGGGGKITENGDGSGYMLVVNGVSTQLLQETAGGSYHAMEENFWKITRNEAADSWTIYDTEGNVYVFDQQAKYAYNSGSGYFQKTYAWYLSSMTNAYGQAITFSYNYQYNFNVGSTRTDTAVYLATVTYPDQRIQIKFQRSTRNDYPSAYDSDEAVHMYEKYKLDYIVVLQDQDGNGGYETFIRKYLFTYANPTDSDQIWYNINYSAGGKTLTLRSVQELGWDTATGTWTGLPAYTFTYDNLHLKTATNGYGGAVTFTYESQPWYRDVASADYTVTDTSCTGWSVYNGATTSCNGNLLTVTTGIVGKGIINTASKNLNRPGGVYKVTFSGVTITGGPINAGIQANLNTTHFGPNNATSHTINPIHKNANNNPKAYFQVTGTASFNKVEVKLLTSVYRVINKKVYPDYNNTPSTYYSSNYTYGPGHTYGADNAFYGHEWVEETTPEGIITRTSYWLDDARHGRSYLVQTYYPGSTSGPENGRMIHESVLNWTKVNLPELYSSLEYEHAWVTLESEINRLFDNNGVQIGGTRTTYTYDPTYGNMLTKSEFPTANGAGPAYRVTTTEYHPNNNGTIYITSLPARVTTVGVDGAKSDTLYFYNNSMNYLAPPTQNILTMTRSWIGGTNFAQTKYEYDAWGNQTKVIVYGSPAGASTNPAANPQHVTQTAYDPVYHTYPVLTTNHLGHEIKIAYDYRLGVPITLTDAREKTTTAEYDAFGRMKKLIRPGDTSSSPTLTMEYINTYPFTTTISQRIDGADYFDITRKYDGMGREIETDIEGVTTTTTYVSATETRQSLPESGLYTTTTVYPSIKKTVVQAPDGTSTVTQTDGFVTTVTDQKGYQTLTTTDVWGRVQEVDPETGPSIFYEYDSFNRQSEVKRSGLDTTFTYDDAGRKISMTDPDMGIWTYTYDGFGNLKTQTDAKLCTTTINYDALNRPTSKNYGAGCSGSQTVSYYYDQNTFVGQRTSMTDASGNTQWSYDDRGQVITETKTISGSTFTTGYEYNSAGLLTKMTYPDGEIVNNDYNDRMLLESVSSLAGYYASSILYDDAGRITHLNRGNNVLDTAYNYNSWNVQGGRLDTLITTRISDQIELQKLDYTYDNAGNIAAINDLLSSEIQSFGYDSLHRLTSAVATNGPANYNESYGYNATTGNLASKGGVTYTYDATHKHAVASLSNGNGYGYDANGNMTTRTVTENGTPVVYTLIYNGENQIAEVKRAGTTIAQFTYDGNGKRVKSVENSVTTLFVGSHYEVTNPGSGQTVTKYYFAGASRIAMRKYTIPQSMSVEFFLSDHLGSTSITTDNAGAKISEMRYTPWGEVRYNWTATQVTTPAYSLPKFTFTGQYSYMDDPSTSGVTEGFGLMFYNARWYDPALGRFAQADSIVPPGVQGLDRYAYGFNNPSRYTDPSGHVVCEIGEPCGPGATYREDKTDWRKLISDKFGITISDEKKVWDETNLIGAYSALIKIDKAMNGNLKSFVGGATFKWGEYEPPADCPLCTYGGWTTHDKTITFNTIGSSAIPQMNIFHEFGHLIDSLPGSLFDVFSKGLKAAPNIDLLVSGGYINGNALLDYRVSDSNYPNGIQAIQASKANDINEQWADIFANYVAGNIDMTDPNGPGIAMDAFVRGALSQHIGAP